MFGSNSGGSSLFGGGLNTSTPTSKITQTDNAFQPRQKSASGGLFGDVSTSRLNGASTPSPSGGLFGNKGKISASQEAPGALFGGNANQGSNSRGLFGNSNNSSTPTTNLNIGAATNTSAGGLFGSTSQTANGSGLFSKPNANSGNNSSLFGGSASNSLNANSNGGIFGNSASAPKSSQANAPGFFNGSSSIPSSNGNFSTASFSAGQGATNFGGNSAMSLSGTQGNAQTFAATSNPYGLQFNAIAKSAGSMPESITTSILKSNAHSKNEGGGDSSQKTSGSSSSLPSNLKSNGTLIGKLSSRLRSTRSNELTQGLFSPARKPIFRQEIAPPSSVTDSNLKDHSHFQRGLENGANANRSEASDMRKLKIDTGRSAAKKMKLLSGQSAITSTKILGSRELRQDSEEPKGVLQKREGPSSSQRDNIEPEHADKELHDKAIGYWCSPTIEQLSRLPIKQLCSVSNFVIGRQGFGSISFDNDVDLSSYVSDLKNSLFGKIVIFHGNKTVEVYPDGVPKPPLGYGLNVPATITLEQIYAVGKKSRTPLKEHSAEEVQLLTKKLRRLKGMSFVSYNPLEGLWTFKVQHFSIWGLIDENGAENEQRLDFETEHKQRKIAVPRHRSIAAKPCQTFDKQATDGTSIHPRGGLGMDQVAFGTLVQNKIEAEDVNLCELVEEKQYEPSDVEPEDFEGMEAKTSLGVTNNWAIQLELADDPHNSAFRSTNSQSSGNKEVSTLSQAFDETFNTNQNAKRSLRLTHTPKLAKFCKDSKLLCNSKKTPSGCILADVLVWDNESRNRISQTLKKNYINANINMRKSNDYPMVKDFSVTISEMEATLAVGEGHNIWKLFSILFDEKDLSLNNGKKLAPEELVKGKRYQLLCSWVVQEVSKSVLNRIESMRNPNESIFYQLIIGNIVGATKAAIKLKNPHLAALITLLNTNNPNVQFLASQQLRKWKALNRKVDLFVVKIYQLLSGQPFDQTCVVDLAKELSWLECLSVYLLFSDVKASSLEEFVAHFLEAHPISAGSTSHEVTFSVLKFFCSEIRDEKMLKRMRVSKNLFDDRAFWFLIQTLRFKQCCNFTSEETDAITLQFLEQLEANELYGEALFTLLFMHSDVLAKQHIDDLIKRHVHFFAGASGREDLKRFGAPDSLIYQAIALRHKNKENYLAEAENLLEGGLVEDAVKTLLFNVGPEMVLKSTTNEHSLKTLRDILDKIPSEYRDVSSRDLGVFSDYLSFALDGNTELTTLERLIRALPSFHATYGHVSKISISCSVMAYAVSLAYLKKENTEAAAFSVKDQLLRLPLGEPEARYIRKNLEAL
ncbi:LAQU0S08e04808g1_1 [Lachancea quebecensis]|uniref:LAQU0S08e04808g1_1 n=1 Tax=Lachancea quebecensis TaxID=1654605 RepID=A0A0P1KTJ5_9SACH|nr:LAQU0S08e04808g1_1 [Lachancea quebecensis]